MKPYIELTKPRIALMVVVTALIGFRLAGNRDWVLMVWMVLGTALAACSAGTLNQYLEKDRDALMRRTSVRPLPEGRLQPVQALVFGLVLAFIGPAILAWKVNWLSCVIALFTIFSYICVYTPLKSRTPQSTWIGAAAGATGPLIGWASATGKLGLAAWALFLIQFLWQIPHFLAIFWRCREDYARAGFRVMPVVDPSGRNTAFQIAVHSLALLAASLFPTLCGIAGVPYGYGALILGTLFLGLGMRASWTMASLDTGRLFFASLIYLPVLFTMLVLGQA